MPKAAFSCLLVLAALDTFHTWLLRSYSKTKEKTEWLVAPLIVLFGSLVGMLNAVFLGIILSTFIFVATFFRSGVVKFIASGLTVRSTIERSTDCASWLDENGDLVQIIVLQNYLFFGNSASILAYISSMFEEVDNEEAMESEIPPLPKFVILDLTLVTGMDTSTVDVFLQMKELCSRYECKLFLAGISSSLQGTLSQGGFRPEPVHRSERRVRFFVDLDTALGTAEDNLLYQEGDLWPPHGSDGSRHDSLPAWSESGFLAALRKIDEEVRVFPTEPALAPFLSFLLRSTEMTSPWTFGALRNSPNAWIFLPGNTCTNATAVSSPKRTEVCSSSSLVSS